MTVTGLGPCGLVPAFLKLQDGAHTGLDGVVVARARAVRLAPADGAPAPVGIDGEQLAPSRARGRSVELVSYPGVFRFFTLPRAEPEVSNDRGPPRTHAAAARGRPRGLDLH